MKHIKAWLRLATLFIITVLFSTTIYAVDLSLDNTLSLEQGTACEAEALYRAGTTATYGGQAIDLLIEITAEDNEYDQIDQGPGPCIGVANGILETRLRDTDSADDRAFMDLNITIVLQGTTTPVEVDRITFSGFDLDTNGAGETSTDDLYMKSPSRGYIEAGGISNVTYIEGDFGDGYNIGLQGQTPGDCTDTAGSPTTTCRGGGIVVYGSNGPNKVTSVDIRISNDNAYGQSIDNNSYRLIQLSFKEIDFEVIIQSSTDHGDIPATYGDASHTVSVFTVLGYGEPADDENAQYSVDADTDDDPDVGNINFDDEDGVRIGNQPTVGSELDMTVGYSYDLNVTTVGDGYLSAWIDLNGDGDFDDAGEQILTDTALNSTVALTTIIPISIPSSNYVGTSYARFRFDVATGAGPSGARGEGEVEDYKVVFNPAGNIIGNIYNDLNGNGIQDTGEPNLPNIDVLITAANGEQQTVTTDAGGDYIATGVSVGDATVDIDDTTLPAGATETEGTDPTTVTVNADVDNFEQDNGYHIPVITINDVTQEETSSGTTDFIFTVSIDIVSTTDVTVVYTTTDGTATTVDGDYVTTTGIATILAGDTTTTVTVPVNGDLTVEGDDTFTVDLSNPSGATNTDAQGRGTITNDDLSSTVTNDNENGTTGNPTTVDVIGNDNSGTSPLDPTTVTIVDSVTGTNVTTLVVPGEGTWNVNTTIGDITFTPEIGFIGDPTPIEYTVLDTGGNSGTGTVSINYPPVANDDEITGALNELVTLNVLANDHNTTDPLDPTTVRFIDPSGNEVTTLTVAGEGTWSVDTATGEVTFDPDMDFTGDASAPYVVRETNGDVSNEATITIHYPVTRDDTLNSSNPGGTSETVSILDNDADGIDPTTIQIVGTDNPGESLTVAGEGVWSIDPTTGNITFIPEPDFLGDPTPIEYTVEYNGVRVPPVTVSITYTVIDPAPTTPPLATDNLDIPITHYGPTVIDVLANGDTWGSNGPGTQVFIFTQPIYGTVALDDGGTPNDPTDDVLIYTPAPDKNNIRDSFTYTITDAAGNTATATVTLNVKCASSQTSDGGDALGMISMLMMMFFTAMAGLYFVRKEEERGEA